MHLCMPLQDPVQDLQWAKPCQLSRILEAPREFLLSCVHAYINWCIDVHIFALVCVCVCAVGFKTGPDFWIDRCRNGAEVRSWNARRNNEKHFPPGVGLQLYVSRGAILHFARTVRGFNNGAFMLYNIPAPLLNPCPALFLNARFPAPKVSFRKDQPECPNPYF